MAKRKGSKKRKKQRLPDVLSKKERANLLNAPSRKSVLGIRNRCILGLMSINGLRVSEVAKLKVTDVRLAADIPYVRIIGKGDKERHSPLGGGMLDMLKEWNDVRPKGTKVLFPVVQGGRRTFGTARRGRAIGTRGIAYMVTHFAKKAGIDRKIHPHTLRHTAATILLASGENIRKVQTILGHADISTTQIYTKITDTELAAMMRRADPGKATRKGDGQE